jgi:hypothetical protein
VTTDAQGGNTRVKIKSSRVSLLLDRMISMARKTSGAAVLHNLGRATSKSKALEDRTSGAAPMRRRQGRVERCA